MSFQTKAELDKWFESPDPWNYEVNKDDKYRKDKIYDAIASFAPYKRALDIGAAEGFITRGLPAKAIEAIEISDKAANRMPHNIKRVHEPKGMYDLIIATGVLYPHYNWKLMRKWIEEHASGVVLVSHYYKIGKAHDKFNKTLLLEETFKYRDGEQTMKVYKW